jgi:hypothetical protein
MAHGFPLISSNSLFTLQTQKMQQPLHSLLLSPSGGERFTPAKFAAPAGEEDVLSASWFSG